jgi:hypothetical protein
MINVRMIRVYGQWIDDDYVTDEPRVREYSFNLYEDFETWAEREGWDCAYWSCSDPVDDVHAWQSRYFDTWYNGPWTHCEESMFFLTNPGPTGGMHTRFARRKWARETTQAKV